MIFSENPSHHARRVFPKTMILPLINLTANKTVDKLFNKFHKIRKDIGISKISISFTVGVGDNILFN